MNIGTKGHFAVAAMLDLALHDGQGAVPLSAIGLRQHISKSTLELLFSRLLHHGMVASFHGPGGGYTVGRSVDDVTIAEIISAVQDPPVHTNPSQTSSVLDSTQNLSDAFNAEILQFTHAVSLGSMVLAQQELLNKADIQPSTMRGVFRRPDQFTIPRHVPTSVFELGRSRTQST